MSNKIEGMMFSQDENRGKGENRWEGVAADKRKLRTALRGEGYSGQRDYILSVLNKDAVPKDIKDDEKNFKLDYKGVRRAKIGKRSDSHESMRIEDLTGRGSGRPFDYYVWDEEQGQYRDGTPEEYEKVAKADEQHKVISEYFNKKLDGGVVKFLNEYAIPVPKDFCLDGSVYGGQDDDWSGEIKWEDMNEDEEKELTVSISTDSSGNHDLFLSLSRKEDGWSIDYNGRLPIPRMTYKMIEKQALAEQK